MTDIEDNIAVVDRTSDCRRLSVECLMIVLFISVVILFILIPHMLWYFYVSDLNNEDI